MNYSLLFCAVLLLTASSAVLGIGDDSRLDGKPLSEEGRLIDTSEGTSGTVFALSETQLHLKSFFFGNGTSVPSDTHFILGSTSYDKTKTLNTDEYIVVPDEVEQSTPLEKYENQTLFLTLPAGQSIQNYKYFALYSNTTNMSYGVVEIADNWTPPTPIFVGQFSQLQHQVRSGDVTVLDTKTIRVQGFNYDGDGPDAFFYVGNTERVVVNAKPLGKIPDEEGISNRKAKGYTTKDIILKLPDGVTIYDIKWLSMYCIGAGADFGNVRFDDIKDNTYLPVVTELMVETADMNCEQLSDNMQVLWKVDGGNINFKLAGKIARTYYMAFGLSGADDGPRMLGADVVVGNFPEGSENAIAVDYNLTQKAQCSTRGGVCPDTQLLNPGTNNVMMVYGSFMDGITSIYYTRAAQTSDSNDKQYKLDGTAQQIVWAIGPINTKQTANKHTEYSKESKTINFARPTSFNCEPFDVRGPEIEKPDFKEHHLYGDDTNVFTAEIGPSVSTQGYTAITGGPSWGIAWYINGTLIPELHLIRGKEYTFRVAGGSNRTSEYHPFYITDNRFGGYETHNATEQAKQTIYPGMDSGSSVSYAVGDLCKWVGNDDFIQLESNEHVWQCFEEYKSYLNLDCVPNNNYTEFKWTAGDTEPSPVYYQCYTHQNLGWKIHLYTEDEYPTTKIESDVCDWTSTDEPQQQTTTGASTGTTSAADLNCYAIISLVLFTLRLL